MNKPAYNKQLSNHSSVLSMILGLCVLWTSFAVAQDNDTPANQQAVIEIVRLQHRDPDVVREALAPHLDPRGSISQIDHNLIISTSRANLSALEDLIAEIDVPLKQLLVRVDFNYGGNNVQTQSDGSTLNSISTDDVREHPVQSLLVTEGEFAYFNRRLATPSTNVAFGPFGLQLQQDNASAEQSFTVQARMQGEQIALTVAMSQSFTGDSIEPSLSQALQTALTIDQNRWVPLNPSPSFAQFGDDQTSFATSNSSSEDVLAVRVELMP